MATSIKLLNSNAVMNGFSLASSGKMLTSRGSQTEQDDVEMEVGVWGPIQKFKQF